MGRLAQRMSRIQSSSTLVVTAKALELKALGKPVISLSVGEPDFETPDNIKEAGIAAIRSGQTRYTAVSGIHTLRQAIAGKLKRENNIDYTPDQIIVCNGGKHALFNAALVLFEEGDEVLIPTPYWVSYPDQVFLAGAEPVYLNTDDRSGFKISVDQLEKGMTSKTKALIFNSPNNPTGAAYTRDELTALAHVCVRHNVWMISDEIYEHLIYDGFEHVSIASLSPAIKEKTITINGVSKCYAMTGWRMGYAAGPLDVIKAMIKLQGQATSNICSITQAACVEALNGPQDAIKVMGAEFVKRRDFLVGALRDIPGLSCTKPVGAFYVFPKISSLFGKKTPKGNVIRSSDDLSLYFLEDHLVATVAGSGFGADEYLRLSYATDLDSIKEAARRIKQAVGELG